MSELSINIGFVIFGVIGLYLFLIGIYGIIDEWIERKVKKVYNSVYKPVPTEPVGEVLSHTILDDKAHITPASLFWLKTQAGLKSKDQDLDDWILKERFIKDLDDMKAKADDFANQLEMRSTERDAKEYQSKLKIIK